MSNFIIFTELSPWGLLIASYLFLGGASGGAFCMAALGEIKKEYQPLSKWAGLVSTPAIIIGLFFLLADLGGPTRAMNVFANWESSVMTWGSIIIVLFTLVGLFYISFWFEIFPWSKRSALRKTISEIGLILALATMVYTGVLLGVSSGRPLWNSPFVPFLFAISGLDAGIALTVIFAAVAPRDKTAVFHAMERIHKLDDYVIVSEFVVLTLLLGTVAATSFTGFGSVEALVTGQFSLLFWTGLVVLGLLFPLSLKAYTRSKKRSVISVIVVSSFAVAISSLALRFLILSSGYSIPIPYTANFFDVIPGSSPTLSDYLITGGLFVLLAVLYVFGSLLLRSQEPKPETPLKAVGVSPLNVGIGAYDSDYNSISYPVTDRDKITRHSGNPD